jgi:Sugar-transfer associated ATP-grasp
MNRIRRLLIILNNIRIRRLLTAKIRKIKKGLNMKDGGTRKPGTELREKHLQLWKDYRRSINPDWLDVYTAISGRQNHRYVPEDIYYTEIEPRLNNKLFSKAWTDKNSYDLFLGGRVKMPEVVLRCIDGVLYTPDFRPAGRPGEFRGFPDGYEGRNLVIKPTMDSGGGKAVRVISCSGGSVEMSPHVQGVTTLPQLFGLYGGNFIIQKYIVQHHWFARFNESSLNTVRVLTYRSIKNEEPVVLHRLLRAGRPGSVVDNQASGGIACAINTDGRLMSFGVDKAGRRHKGTESLDFGEAGEVPFMKEISAAALEVASCYRYSRLLGLDFAVSQDGEVILIEVNDSNNEINFFQMSSGPLFGSFTEEVASSCMNLPRSFVIDYII